MNFGKNKNSDKLLHMIKKKIFFFGTPEIANPSLEKISELNEYEIVGVGVFPDRKIGRKQIYTSCPVKKLARKLGFKIFEIPNKESLVEIYKTQKFDLGMVIAFGMIFPQEILEDQKFVNVHFSLLPEYRGASPVQTAILEGQKESGITWQTMVSKLDAGDILFQKTFDIENQKTSEVWNDFSEKTAELFPEFLEKYFSDQLYSISQIEAKATFCHKFQKSDGEIFPQLETAEKIYQKFLAFNVQPKIFIKTEKGFVKITDANLQNEKESYKLKCKNNSFLFIKKAQISGKKEMKISEILKGHPCLFEN